MRRIPSLDGFRAISIMLVLFCHSRLSVGFPSSLTDIARQCEVGVTIFFVISGFLITSLLLREEQSTGSIAMKSFYLRRLLRIMPVYFLYLSFILVWCNFEAIGLTRSNLFHVLTFTVNFDKNKNWFLGHFWSLSAEEQFYLFWPAMLLPFRKHIRIVAIVLIGYSALARVIAYKMPAMALISLSPFFNYTDAIFIGAIGGIFFAENPRFFKAKYFRSYVYQLLALLLLVAFVYFTEHGKFALISLPLGNTIISLSALFLIGAYINPSDSMIYKLLNSKLMIQIGILSYSIYIWQEFFFVGQFDVFWRSFPFNIGMIIAVSVLSYYLWELPFLRLKRRFSASAV